MGAPPPLPVLTPHRCQDMVNIQFAPSINQETGMAPQYPQLSRRSFCERDDSALQWLQKLREYLWKLYCISIVNVLECLFLNAEAAGRLAGLGSLRVFAFSCPNLVELKCSIWGRGAAIM